MKQAIPPHGLVEVEDRLVEKAVDQICGGAGLLDWKCGGLTLRQLDDIAVRSIGQNNSRLHAAACAAIEFRTRGSMALCWTSL